ncbi:RNA methyltransferase, TrmH family, partial [Ancylostoma ceylanicum]
LSGTVDGSTASDRPNLIYRKAKITGKSLEELRSLNVPVPKFRGEAVFGVYPVLEALATGARDFFGLYVKDTVRARSSHDERISKILEHARMLGLPVRRLTHSQFDKITDFQLHNGICLDASPLRFSYHLSDMQLTTVYLDNVLDPGNFGAIARSALFFGCEQIAYAEGRGPSRITPAMSKASCGALECSRVVRVPSFLSFHKVLSTIGLFHMLAPTEQLNEQRTHIPHIELTRHLQTLKSAGAVFVGTSDAVSARKFGKPTIELNELEVQSGQKLVVVLGT